MGAKKVRPIGRIVQAEKYIAGQKPPKGVHLGHLGKGIPEAYCLTNRGVAYVNDGDWILPELDGTYYPCPDEIFKQSYELVLL